MEKIAQEKEMEIAASSRSRLASRKGSVLAYALVMVMVVSILLTSFLQYINSQLKFSFYLEHKEEAFQVAEAGLSFYRWYLAHEVSGKTVQQIQDFWDSGTAYGVAGNPYEADFFNPSGEAIGKYRIEVQRPELNSTILWVKATGWTYSDPNVKRTIQARFRRPSWSEFAVIGNDVMRFGEGTQVYGRIHSNQGIHFDGVAHNIVSSAVDKYDDPDHTDNMEFGVHTHVNPPPDTGVNENYRPAEAPSNTVPLRTDVFLAGREFPVPTVDFNGLISDLNNLKTKARAPSGTLLNDCTATGCYFDESGFGRRIILKANGTFDVCIVSGHENSNTTNSGSYSISRYQKNVGNQTCSTCSGDCAKTYPIPDTGIIFVEDHIWIEGIIDHKKITVVAANLIGETKANIYLGFDNLLYTNFDGTDTIGLIAQQDISVVRDSLDNLVIDAALIAQSGRVGRDHYPNAYNKDTITINGSMATNLRYGFAHTDGSGYDNRIFNFDNNLLYYPPPYFPTGTEYAIDLWDEIKTQP